MAGKQSSLLFILCSDLSGMWLEATQGPGEENEERIHCERRSHVGSPRQWGFKVGCKLSQYSNCLLFVVVEFNYSTRTHLNNPIITLNPKMDLSNSTSTDHQLTKSLWV